MLCTTPTVIYCTDTRFPEPRNILYNLQQSAGASVPLCNIQNRKIEMAEPLPASHSQSMHLIRVCSQNVLAGGPQPNAGAARGPPHLTTPSSVPGMPWQHHSSACGWLAVLSHFQVSTGCSTQVQSLSQVALNWVWLLINICHLGGAFTGQGLGDCMFSTEQITMRDLTGPSDISIITLLPCTSIIQFRS